MCAFFVERFRFTMHFRQFCAKVGSLDTDEGQSENTFSPVILLITKTTKFHRSVYCRRVFVWARVNGSHCHEPFFSFETRRDESRRDIPQHFARKLELDQAGNEKEFRNHAQNWTNNKGFPDNHAERWFLKWPLIALVHILVLSFHGRLLYTLRN